LLPALAGYSWRLHIADEARKRATSCGAPDKVVRTVTENCRTLKFATQRFEAE
jgi:hypothetical protein